VGLLGKNKGEGGTRGMGKQKKFLGGHAPALDHMKTLGVKTCRSRLLAHIKKGEKRKIKQAGVLAPPEDSKRLAKNLPVIWQKKKKHQGKKGMTLNETGQVPVPFLIPGVFFDLEGEGGKRQNRNVKKSGKKKENASWTNNPLGQKKACRKVENPALRLGCAM